MYVLCCGVKRLGTLYSPFSINIKEIFRSFLYYFKKVAKKNAKKGGFMFWNTTSYVALVVTNDGTTIKYSQHSNVKQSQVRKTYSSDLDVSFYNCIK